MISMAILSRFGLVMQDKKSPDGFPLYIAESLSRNGPTVFFELLTHKASAGDDIPDDIVDDFVDNFKETSIRITKAGAINHMFVSQTDLESKSFTDLQQEIEKTLHIPE